MFPVGRWMERREGERRAHEANVPMNNANNNARSRYQVSGSAAKTPMVANTVPSTVTSG
jgi:hypothetical protein